MPDLIDNGKGGHTAWADELCAACKKQSREKCPLLAALYELRIVSTSSYIVYACDGYDPDPSSPYYFDPEARPDGLGLKRVLQEIELLVRPNA